MEHENHFSYTPPSDAEYPDGSSLPPVPPEDLKRNARRHFRSLGLMYFLGTLIVFAVQYAVIFLVNHVSFIQIRTMDASLLLSSLPMYLVSMPLMALLIQRVPAVALPKHNITFLQWLLSFFMCYAIMYLSNLLGLLCTWLIGLCKGSPVENLLPDIITELSPGVAFFLTVLCAPILEEFIFRKLLIDRTAKYGEGIAVLFSALFFGLFHGNLNQFVYAFALGAFFGFLYIKTGKLRYTVFLHMTVNFLGSVAGLLLLNSHFYQAVYRISGGPTSLISVLLEHPLEIILISLYGLLVFGFLIAGIICLAVNAKKMKLNPGEISLPKKILFPAAFLNVGVILFSLFWVVQILQQLFA